jgi:uncharacterized damage-inducible protein DinB
MMILFYKELLDRFHELHSEIEKSLDGLPQEALDWQPGAEMNSICVLVVHLTGAERYWIGDVVMGDPSNRNREAEFQAKGLSAEVLKQRLKEVEAYLTAAFENMNLLDLEKPRKSRRNGRELSVTWALTHALEHTAIHLGHIQIMRQMLRKKKSISL